MKIGDLAQATGTPVDTIRFYEREQLLPAPGRTAANYRVYGAAHADRLRFIRRARSLDMSLDEIRALLAFKDAPGPSCESVNAVLDAHMAHVYQRIAELQALAEQLSELRSQCATDRSGADCGILGGLARPAETGT